MIIHYSYTVLAVGKVFPAFKYYFGDYAMYVNVFYFFCLKTQRKAQTQLLGKAYKVQCSLACRLPTWLQSSHNSCSYIHSYVHTYIHMLLCPYSYICMCMHECAQIPMSIFISYVVRKRLYFMSALLEHTVMHIHVCSMLCACRRNHRYT